MFNVLTTSSRAVRPLFLAVLLTAIGQGVSASERLTQLSQAAINEAQAESQAATGPVRRISVDESVQLALEHNLDIQVERFNPQIQDMAVAEARSFWIPGFSTTFFADSANTPASGFLSGGETRVSDDQFSAAVGVDQLLPWGGRYTVGWNTSRATTTSFLTSFNPVLRSNLNFSVVQPLLRDFSIDSARQQLLVTQKSREISDVQLRQAIVSTVRDVKNAYWELVFALSSLDVQRQSLDLANRSLEDNRRRVEVGTMAPIDIVEAEAEVARNEESVIVAEAAIESAEDRLRALIYDPAMPDFWNLTIQPSDAAVLQTQPIDVNTAVSSALSKRTDLVQSRKTLESTDINIRYFRNQILPAVNVEANYGLAGLGGTQFEDFSGLPSGGGLRPILGQRSFGSVLGDIFSNDFPTWTLGITVGYPIGTSSADANLSRARVQYAQSQTEIKNLELRVSTEVRDLGRQVNTNLKRVEATRAAKQLAERRLEAEQKKFTVGMSTTFIVFQVQRDLTVARNNELRAILDYNRSLVDFEAVQEASLNGVSISNGSSASSGGTRSTSPATSVTGATIGATPASLTQR